MSRDDLDAFFAKAEDVLTDWEPDPFDEPDVMFARTGDEGAELPVADSFYAQADDFGYVGAVPTQAAFEFGRSLTLMIDQYTRELARAVESASFLEARGWQPLGFTADGPVYFAPLGTATEVETRPETARERALRLRRERNRGPDDQRGLDGHRRRRA